MANENEIADFRKNFLFSYANQNYMKYQAIREMVRDCVSGTATMKGVGGQSQSGGGNDYTTVMKYLLPTERHKKKPNEYLRYMMMADFPGYSESALLIGLGLLCTGQDTVNGMDKLPESLKSMEDTENGQTNSNLMSLRLAINKAQMVDGGCVCFLELADIEAVQNGSSPFYVNLYSYDKYVNSNLDKKNGPLFVLMDESDWLFNYDTKSYEYDNRYRVYGIDGRGYYYQSAIRAEQWVNFNILEPEEWDNELYSRDPKDPQFGRAWYPHFGDGERSYLREIPVDFCNVTNHSWQKYENPMLTVLSDKDIMIYNADAAYRQTLWLTSQPINVIYGDGKHRNLPYGAGAVHDLPINAREEWLEFSGAGANAQRTALADLHEKAAEKAMSLFATGSNVSGEALRIIQGSQVAPLVSLVNTSGETITKMLRLAAKWCGVEESKIKKLNYVPSEMFARLNLSSGEILSWFQFKKENPNTPVKWSELRRRMEESGIADEVVKDFDKFMDEIGVENDMYGGENTPYVQKFDMPMNAGDAAEGTAEESEDPVEETEEETSE